MGVLVPSSVKAASCCYLRIDMKGGTSSVEGLIESILSSGAINFYSECVWSAHSGANLVSSAATLVSKLSSRSHVRVSTII